MISVHKIDHLVPGSITFTDPFLIRIFILLEKNPTGVLQSFGILLKKPQKPLLVLSICAIGCIKLEYLNNIFQKTNGC